MSTVIWGWMQCFQQLFEQLYNRKTVDRKTAENTPVSVTSAPIPKLPNAKANGKAKPKGQIVIVAVAVGVAVVRVPPQVPHMLVTWAVRPMAYGSRVSYVKKRQV